MDFINKAYGRVVDLFGSMTPAARITTALLAVAIVISLVYLFYYRTSSSAEFLEGAFLEELRAIRRAEVGLAVWHLG